MIGKKPCVSIITKIQLSLLLPTPHGSTCLVPSLSPAQEKYSEMKYLIICALQERHLK